MIRSNISFSNGVNRVDLGGVQSEERLKLLLFAASSGLSKKKAFHLIRLNKFSTLSISAFKYELLLGRNIFFSEKLRLIPSIVAV